MKSSRRKPASFSIKGILFGVCFTLLATLAFSVILRFAFASFSGVTMDEPDEFKLAFQASEAMQLAVLLGGLLIALATGFVAEWFAPKPTLINAAVCGGLLMLFHLAKIILESSTVPVWSQAMMIFAIIPCSICGGWLYSGFYRIRLAMRNLR